MDSDGLRVSRRPVTVALLFQGPEVEQAAPEKGPRGPAEPFGEKVYEPWPVLSVHISFCSYRDFEKAVKEVLVEHSELARASSV